MIVNIANTSCPFTGRQVNHYALSFVCLPVCLADRRVSIRRRGTIRLPLHRCRGLEAQPTYDYFFTQKSPTRMCPSPRIGFSSQPPVVEMWQPRSEEHTSELQ